MTRIHWHRRFAPLRAIYVLLAGALAVPGPVAAMQILDAADHAELAAEISATQVNRIALAGDRIAKAVRAPDGFAVEHDARSGDLYLRRAGPASGQSEPVTLFIGTEKGFTYRLTLIPADRDSAQILIRNDEVLPNAAIRAPAAGDSAHVWALVRLVRAVARREPLPGYEIQAGGVSFSGSGVIETWRGPRLRALVLEADLLPAASMRRNDIAGLAGTIERLPGIGRVAAVWLAAPGTGPSGGRLAVAVTETAPAGDPR